MSSPLAKACSATDLYDRDFFQWTVQQAQALRASRPADVDWENVAEEIESLGKSDKSSIESNLNVVLLHLLKWHYQPGERKPGWKFSIAEHRRRINRLIGASPSLQSFPGEVLQEEYNLARFNAADETALKEADFPKSSPFTIDQILDPNFLAG